MGLVPIRHLTGGHVADGTGRRLSHAMMARPSPHECLLMDRRWLPLNALRAFEAVGRHGSFTAAAQSLLVSQSAVSRHVIGLEDFLGVPLFDRKPQQPALTEAGRRLLPVVEKALDRIDATLEEILRERGKPRRSLRVLLPTTFAQRLAVPILRDFRAEFPDVTLD